MDMIKIGKFIAQNRKKLGYTQEELGNLMSVSDKAVSKWERGISFPDVASINKLAVLLKTSVIAILEGGEIDAKQNSNIDNGQVASPCSLPFSEKVEIEFTQTNSVVSQYLFGSNLEHTRSDVFMGISAQMLKNRKFVGKPSAVFGNAVGWYPIGEKTFYELCVEDTYTTHVKEHHHMCRDHECNSQKIMNTYSDHTAGIGQHEISLQKNTSYDFAIVAKSNSPLKINVRLTSHNGEKVYDQKEIIIDSTDWQRYTANLIPTEQDLDADLQITFSDIATINIGAISLMPLNNFHGMRTDVVDALKDMGIKLLRWPGGNFAGEYNWFDGLLPVDKRAPFQSFLGLETQPHSMGYDFHEINTDDFIALCREIGAQPFITINPTWNTPKENAMWVEYCNGDENTEYGKLRIERGFKEPYNVQFWSLGNEFGYGHMEGDNTPYGYQSIAHKHAEEMLQSCKNISFCSSGPYPNKDWADHAAIPLEDVSPLVSLHYYAPERKYEDIEASYKTAVDSVQIARNKICQFRDQLNDNLRISFDEWNTWYAWYHPSCVADGIFTALMLNMFIVESESKGIAVACHFEAVNEGAIAVTPTHATLTATGQAFSMMKHHIDGALWYISDTVLATVKDGIMTVTAINEAYNENKTVKIPICAQKIKAQMYYGKELLPHSRFEICDVEIEANKDGYTACVPSHSMLLLQFKL